MSDQQQNPPSEKKPSSKSDKFLTGFILLLLIFVVGYNIANFFGPQLFLKGEKISVLQGKDPLSGRDKTIRINSRDTLINFWATWCSACLTEMHDLKELSKEVTVIGVMKGPLDKSTINELNLKFQNILVNDELLNKYMISVLPTTILVRKGTIIKVKTGTITKEEVREWLKEK